VPVSLLTGDAGLLQEPGLMTSVTGSATISDSSGSVSYTGSGSGSFTYTVGDQEGHTAIGTVNVTHTSGTGDAAHTITGTAGSDILIGGGTNDILHAGAGNDILIGGSGNDIMYGEGGTNRFVFSDKGSEGTDTIKDFNKAADILRFDDVIHTGNGSPVMADLKGTFDVGSNGDVTLHLGASGSTQTTVVVEKAATDHAAVSGQSLSELTTQLNITVELDKNSHMA